MAMIAYTYSTIVHVISMRNVRAGGRKRKTKTKVYQRVQFIECYAATGSAHPKRNERKQNLLEAG